jgi:hypothetical protein
MGSIVVVMWTLIISGCATGYTWKTVGMEEAFRATAMKRASFELECPAEQIAVTPLSNTECKQRSDGPYVCAGGQMGVSGCGKRTTFRFPALGAGDEWVRDSEVVR